MAEIGNPAPGLFLSDWDERQGPRVVGQIMPEIDEDPEMLATSSYMSAQHVFSSAEFSRISFTLPNLKIRRKIKLYFDVVSDYAVRGGMRPFLIAVLVPIDVPDAFFANVDPLIELAQEQYKEGTVPDLAALQLQIQGMDYRVPSPLGSETENTEKIAPPAEGGDENPPIQEAPLEQVVRLKIYCEICKKDLPIAFSRAQLRKMPDSDLAEYTYIHAFDEEGLEPHGLRISVDQEGVLAKLEYVDVAGNRISPVQEQDLEGMTPAAGPWTTQELETLMVEIKNGTPKRSLARLFQRPVAEIEIKLQEIERDKLTYFNKIVAESTAEAKLLEETDSLAAKKLWVKLAEYCLEFSKTAGLAPSVAGMIRKKTAGILARAKNL